MGSSVFKTGAVANCRLDPPALLTYQQEAARVLRSICCASHIVWNHNPMFRLRRSAQFLLFGGCGDELDSPRVRPLLSKAIAQVGIPSPRVLILATASGDQSEQLARSHNAWGMLGCPTTHLNLFQYRDPEWQHKIESADLVWVCGGSTANLLLLWRNHEIGQALADRHNLTPLVFAGTSAGMNCWFDSSISWSGGEFAPLQDGLGWIEGSACPHADSQPARTEAWQSAVASEELPSGLAIGEETVLWAEVSDRSIRRSLPLSLGDPVLIHSQQSAYVPSV